jgi:hypothetical protein
MEEGDFYIRRGVYQDPTAQNSQPWRAALAFREEHHCHPQRGNKGK